MLELLFWLIVGSVVIFVGFAGIFFVVTGAFVFAGVAVGLIINVILYLILLPISFIIDLVDKILKRDKNEKLANKKQELKDKIHNFKNKDKQRQEQNNQDIETKQ